MSLVQPAAWQGARAQRGRGGAPRGAAWPPLPRRRTDFTHFRDCGHPTVCRRGGRNRMRQPRRQTASAIPGARQPRGQRRLAATAAPPPHGCRQQCRRQPPPPAAAASCRQHCSDSSLCCPGAAAATSVTATSAAAVSVAMAAAAARRASEELHMSVCVWRLCGASVLAEKPQVFRIPNALRVCLEERSDESVRSGPSLLGAAPPRAVSRDSVGAG